MQTETFALLVKDHEMVKGIIEDLLETSPSAKKTRLELLKTLKKELLDHENLEERVVYPPLETRKATRDLTLEAYQEHHVVDQLLEELESLDFKDEDWKAKLTVLQENLLHHVQEEEKELFPKAEKTLSKDQLKTMEQQIAQAKA
ncbi:MAG: hemerythrin domain-containing protein [Betaproteobacteria bacterium]|nr:hemerythrin domain-containing protein [Betaproteobacteria bacterium]MBU6511295.1 hemerythrin domain-containing protein [Betaproteobacteria bacterium]MDE1954337.1 hemerythrin domain-containing protein [Betaproteobacteria bacterium]